MRQSAAFVIEGKTATRVVVAANLDGTLTFELTRNDTGPMSDLEAIFFDLSVAVPAGGFRVYGDAGVCLAACAAEGVDTLGRSVTIREQVIDPLGDFDIGLHFGAMPEGARDARRVGFTLAHDWVTLSLDMIDRADFALRDAQPVRGDMERATASAGAHPADLPRRGAARAGFWSDALAIIELHEGGATPLASDPGGVLAVIDVGGSDAQISVAEAAWQPEACDRYGPRGMDLAERRGGSRRIIATGHWSGLSPLG